MIELKTIYGEKRYFVSYDGQNFDGCVFKHRDLAFLDFSNSKLCGAVFINCKTHNTNFTGCDFSGAVFRDTDFSGAILADIKGLDAGKIQLVPDRAKTPGQVLYNTEHYRSIEAQNNIRENNKHSNFGRPEVPEYKKFKDAL